MEVIDKICGSLCLMTALLSDHVSPGKQYNKYMKTNMNDWL